MQLLWFYYSEGSLDKGCTFPGLCHRSKVGSEANSGKWGWVFRAQGNVGVYWCRSSRSSYLLSVFLMCLQTVSPQYLATLLPWTVQWFVLHGESLAMCVLCYIAKLLCRLVVRLHDSIRDELCRLVVRLHHSIRDERYLVGQRLQNYTIMFGWFVSQPTRSVFLSYQISTNHQLVSCIFL